MKSLSEMLQSLADGMEFDAAEYERKRVEMANQIPGKLTGYDCKLCLNRGYTTEMKENGIVIRVECKCMKTRRSLSRLKRSGLSNLVKDSKFDLFETDTKWREEAKSLAQKFANNPDGHWFFASGTPGCGKTHLCVAICREFMLKGMETRYVLWMDTVKKLKSVVNTDEYQEILDTLRTVKVLYIDDLLKVARNQEPSTADISIACELINDRYIDKNLITVISTERSPEELMKFDCSMWSRIYQRSKGFSFIARGDDKNWRLR